MELAASGAAARGKRPNAEDLSPLDDAVDSALLALTSFSDDVVVERTPADRKRTGRGGGRT